MTAAVHPSFGMIRSTNMPMAYMDGQSIGKGGHQLIKKGLKN